MFARVKRLANVYIEYITQLLTRYYLCSRRTTSLPN